MKKLQLIDSEERKRKKMSFPVNIKAWKCTRLDGNKTNKPALCYFVPLN